MTWKASKKSLEMDILLIFYALAPFIKLGKKFLSAKLHVESSERKKRVARFLSSNWTLIQSIAWINANKFSIFVFQSCFCIFHGDYYIRSGNFDGTNIIYVKTDASNVIHVPKSFSEGFLSPWIWKKNAGTGACVCRKIHYEWDWLELTLFSLILIMHFYFIKKSRNTLD